VAEQTVNYPIDDAYSKLKANLAEKGCKVVSEESPKLLVAKQGSLWGVMPKSAKKTLTCNLKTQGTGTQINCDSKLSRDWLNLTIIGTALSIVVVGLCFWISLDLSAFLETTRFSTWSWIASVGSRIDYEAGESFINLTRLLAFFLSAIIGFEIVVAIYTYSKIDTFAKEALQRLQA
jgi:hypothetical protein